MTTCMTLHTMTSPTNNSDKFHPDQTPIMLNTTKKAVMSRMVISTVMGRMPPWIRRWWIWLLSRKSTLRWLMIRVTDTLSTSSMGIIRVPKQAMITPSGNFVPPILLRTITTKLST